MTTHKTNTPKGRILVVDDTVANLRLLTGILSAQGYLVRPARDGRMALASARAAPSDLILLDIMMPGMNGYEVCTQLKADQRTRDIPVIFLSALNEVLDKVKAFSVGGVDYITKPFHVEEVLARVETHLALRNLQKRLEEKNRELSDTLQHLQTTQKQLIESEKMAALGSLVAGVAHEINTPIGVGVTMASTLANETQLFGDLYQRGKLRRTDLINYLETAKQGSTILLNNLQRAAELVESFKQVAVDQTSFLRREFALKEYLRTTLLSLDIRLKQDKHQVKIVGNERIMVNSYPGALSQVVTNLVINSMTHAYPDNRSGELCFYMSQEEKDVVIEYKDDGCGIQPDDLSRIFEPFFTTARNRGGTGLGLHIVYNLVTQKLQGSISCQSKVGVGTTFIIKLPQEIREDHQ